MTLAADLSLAGRRYPVDMDADIEVVRGKWTTAFRYSRTGTLGESEALALVASAERVFERTVVSMVLDGLFERVPR